MEVKGYSFHLTTTTATSPVFTLLHTVVKREGHCLTFIPHQSIVAQLACQEVALCLFMMQWKPRLCIDCPLPHRSPGMCIETALHMRQAGQECGWSDTDWWTTLAQLLYVSLFTFDWMPVSFLACHHCYILVSLSVFLSIYQLFFEPTVSLLVTRYISFPFVYLIACVLFVPFYITNFTLYLKIATLADRDLTVCGWFPQLHLYVTPHILLSTYRNTAH